MRKPRGHPAGLDVEDGTPVLRVLSFSYKSKEDAFGDSHRPGVFRRISDDASSAPRSPRRLPSLGFASSTPKLSADSPASPACSATDLTPLTRKASAASVLVSPVGPQRRRGAVSRSQSAATGPSPGRPVRRGAASVATDAMHVPRPDGGAEKPLACGESGAAGEGAGGACLSEPRQSRTEQPQQPDSPDTCSLALSSTADPDLSSVAGTSSLEAGASAGGGGGGGGGSSTSASAASGAGGWSQPRTPMGSTTQLIRGKARPHSTWCGMWSVDAALAVLSLSISFGNLARLPRLVLQYGGGSFLAVYCCVSLVLGIPLALLEVGLGQLCEQGVTRVWRAVPLFTGVGIVKVAVSALLAVYWPVLMALSLFFAVWSAKGPLPFNECKHRLSGMDGYIYSRTTGEACLTNTFLKSPVEEPMWFSVTATFLFLLWTISLLCVFRSTRGYRRVLFVLVLAGLAGLIAVLADSAMQPAASVGLDHLLRFDWDALLNVETWYFATLQMFLSTHIGLGNIVTSAGRYYSKSNAVWMAVALVTCSLIVGALWVTVVFLRLGPLFQADQQNQLTTSDLPEALVLTLLYDAATRGNSGQIIASVGFLLIVCAGFASLVPLLDTILAAVHVETKRRWEWWKAASVCCIIGFLLGTLCLLPERLALVHVLDSYVVGRLALACTVTELVAFIWIYGCGPLYTDLEFVVGHKLNPCWKILWCLAPVYLLAVEAWSVAVIPWDGTLQRHDPSWQVLLGWGLYFAGWAVICITALQQVCIQVDYNICQKFLSAVKPSRNWGPADPIYRHCWMQWKDATPASKMDQTLRRRGTRDYTHSVRMASAPDPLHFHHPASRGSGPFLIDSKADLAEHVCWRKGMGDKAIL